MIINVSVPTQNGSLRQTSASIIPVELAVAYSATIEEKEENGKRKKYLAITFSRKLQGERLTVSYKNGLREVSSTVALPAGFKFLDNIGPIMFSESGVNEANRLSTPKLVPLE